MDSELFKFFINNSVKLMVMAGTLLIMLTTKNHFPKHIRKYTLGIFLLIFLYSLVMAFEVYITNIENASFTLVFIRRILSFLGYALRPFIIAFAIFIIQPMTRKQKWLFTIPAFISMAFHLTGLWSGLVTTIDENNIFVRGPLGFISFFVIGLYSLVLIYIPIKTMIDGKTTKGLILIFIVLSCVLGGVCDVAAENTSNYLGNALCVSALFYYLYLNIEYAAQYENQIIKSKENELVLSQVRPHFMYNVLTSIYYLCDHDPKKAKVAINDFSRYLRNNLDNIRGEQMVSFDVELGYVKNYLALEKIRFEDELSFDFEIESSDFEIPKFTLQPLVENAVKHGITQKEGGGHILIYSKDEGDHFIVGVKDNGVGFDPNEKKNDGRSHTGLLNIQSRLIEFLDEDIRVESKIGVGTHIYFKVNKKNKDR